jgi:hypothetical protein
VLLILADYTVAVMTKWTNVYCILLIERDCENIKHNGEVNINVVCPVMVRMQGNNSGKIFHMIIEKSEIKMYIDT